MDGALFAWERHWARMSRDARLLNVAMPPDAGRRSSGICVRLIESNEAPNCTLRLVVVRNGGGLWEGPASGRASDMIALTADSKKWGDSVRLGIQPNARYAASDFTRAKILSWAHNLRWAERAQEQGFDEVILLNEYGRVAECTSANIFAVFGQVVSTPPVSDGCLPGITREVLLEQTRAGNSNGRARIDTGRTLPSRRSVHHINHAGPSPHKRDCGPEPDRTGGGLRTPVTSFPDVSYA